MSYLTPQAEQQGIREAIKAAVYLASTANVNLAGTLTTMDGVSLSDQDRVLLKNQADQKQNGIYVWSSGTQMLTRARDFISDVGSGMIVSVQQGSLYKDSQWQLLTDNPITIGVTNLLFGRAGGYGAIFTQLQMFVTGQDEVDGVTLVKVAGQFSFNPDLWPPGHQFFFGGILSVSDGLRTGGLELHNLTDVEQVTTGSLTTSNTTPTKLESSALTVGSGAGNLKFGEKVYEVRITNDGTLGSEKTFLGSAHIRIGDG